MQASGTVGNNHGTHGTHGKAACLLPPASFILMSSCPQFRVFSAFRGSKLVLCWTPCLSTGVEQCMASTGGTTQDWFVTTTEYTEHTEKKPASFILMFSIPCVQRSNEIGMPSNISLSTITRMNKNQTSQRQNPCSPLSEFTYSDAARCIDSGNKIY